jgi:transcriptional regulator with XRE-family HTH domain
MDNPPMMTGSELRAARDRIGFSPETIARMGRVSVQKIAEWELSDRPVPARLERELREIIRQMDVADEVERRLLAAGFAKCAWLEQQKSLTLEAFAEHARTCASCAERDRIATEFLERDSAQGLIPPVGGFNVSPWLAWLVCGGLVFFFVGALVRGHDVFAENAVQVGLYSASAWVVLVLIVWLIRLVLKRSA